MKKLFLSGTPVQNNVSELLALLSFLMPGIFKKNETEILLEAFNLGQNASQPQMAQSDDDIEAFFTLNHLRQMFAPFVLRREKVGVIFLYVWMLCLLFSIRLLIVIPSPLSSYNSFACSFLSCRNKSWIACLPRYLWLSSSIWEGINNNFMIASSALTLNVATVQHPLLRMYSQI